VPEPTATHTVEVVLGRPVDAWSGPVLRFWAGLGALAGEAAQERLPQVVCVLRDAGGEVAGVSSVFPADVELIGGRRFWIYRRLLHPELPPGDADRTLLRAAFAALEAEFDPDAGAGPIGLCLLLGPEERRRRPEAEWQDPRILYAGYLPDGRQVRFGYVAGARIDGPARG
jgi:hypothetical protein